MKIIDEGYTIFAAVFLTIILCVAVALGRVSAWKSGYEQGYSDHAGNMKHMFRYLPETKEPTK